MKVFHLAILDGVKVGFLPDFDTYNDFYLQRL